jgi:integrase
VQFANPSGETVFRVAGWSVQGSRIRENYPTREAAVARRLELENEFLRGQAHETVRPTVLDAAQLRSSEMAFNVLGDDAEPSEIVRAAKYWVEHGRHQVGPEDAPRLDDAFAQFKEWLGSKSGLRPKTQTGLVHEVNMFGRLVGNPKLGEITPEVLEGFFDRRKVSPIAKDAGRRALSRFFSWCAERPRRWMTSNPASLVRVLPEKREEARPEILTVEACETLLRAAEQEGQGRLVPWFALGLFGGLRPTEAERLEWTQINFTDAEIRLEGEQTKTGSSRVIEINPTLRAWLEAYRHAPLGFSRRSFRRIVEASGVTWTKDVLRHTSATAHLRVLTSYADVARHFGNSETVLKRHYEGRMSSADAQKLFALRPMKKG